jgi:hypothetical protein
MSTIAIESALRSDREDRALRGYFGDAYGALRDLARETAQLPADAPRVLVLPGLMGSKLVEGRDDLVWLDPWDVVRSRLRKLALDTSRDSIRASDVIAFAYLRLKLRLRARGFDADFHAYDWRKSLDVLGAELRVRILAEKRPVHLVGHSMGGVVIRAALWHADLDAARVPSVVTIGSPHRGSFVPVLALRGLYGVVKKLSWLDFKRDSTELVTHVFNTFEGLTQLLPFREAWSERDLYDPKAWPAKIPGPRGPLLARAPSIQAKLAHADARFRLIVGTGHETVVGLGWERGDFTYPTSLEGDGTVPLALARLPDAPVWYTGVEHGEQGTDDGIAHAVADLLASGRTVRLPTTHVPTRRATRVLRRAELARAPYGGRDPEEVSAEERRHVLEEVAGPDPGREARAPEEAAGPLGETILIERAARRLDLALHHGSIVDADARAYLLGVFRGVSPGGAASAIDEELNGAVREITERRMFSADVGQVFVLPSGRHGLLAEHVVFVGLGAFDTFTPEVLDTAAENAIRVLVATKVDDLATVPIGAGTDCSVEQSIEHLLRGFARGLLDAEAGKRFRSITFCETNDVRYGAVREKVVGLAHSMLSSDFAVTITELRPRRARPQIEVEAPARARPIERDRPPAAYLLVRAETGRRGARSLVFSASVLGVGSKATVITERRDVSERELDAALSILSPGPVEHLTLAKVANLGKEIGELVLEQGIRHALVDLAEHPLVVVHDDAASRIPWETLRIGTHVPAIEKGLTRQYLARDLSVAKWLEERRLDPELSILLIVDPTEDLEGAREEGDRLRRLLAGRTSFHVEAIEGAHATKRAILEGFRTGRFDVVHYAGHGFFDPLRPGRSGLICAGDEVLTGIDLADAPHLPALVFFNACEVGRVRAARRGARSVARKKPPRPKPRPRESTGVAESLLRGGVANFVGTYWEVGDAGAKRFAETFYTALLRGDAVDDAVLGARRSLAQARNKDWADYLHYGPRGYRLKIRAR